MGHGFALSVPADATTLTLHLYAAVHAAQAELTVSLSDGSSPNYVDSSLNNSSGTTVEEYTFSYNAASAGQTLTIACTMAVNHGSGNISLEDATLIGPGLTTLTTLTTLVWAG